MIMNINEKVKLVREGRTLRVFDLDDTLLKSNAGVIVVKPDGTKERLTSDEFATHKAKPGETYDFSEFNKMLKNPKHIKRNIQLLKKMLSNPQKKVTILTARGLAFPIRKYFKDELGLDVYVVALGSNNPQHKADWIEKHIQKGYTDIAFMDDSKKNVDAVASLKNKYPNVHLKAVLVSN
jgi:hypothetical protein